LFADSSERLHGFHPLALVSEIAFTDGLSNQVRYSRFLALRTVVESAPEIFIEV
jgi:hypothetical protein